MQETDCRAQENTVWGVEDLEDREKNVRSFRPSTRGEDNRKEGGSLSCSWRWLWLIKRQQVKSNLLRPQLPNLPVWWSGRRQELTVSWVAAKAGLPPRGQIHTWSSVCHCVFQASTGLRASLCSHPSTQELSPPACSQGCDAPTTMESARELEGPPDQVSDILSHSLPILNAEDWGLQIGNDLFKVTEPMSRKASRLPAEGSFYL